MLFSIQLLVADSLADAIDGYFGYGIIGMVLMLLFGPGIYDAILAWRSSSDRDSSSDDDSLPPNYYRATCPSCGSERAAGQCYDARQSIDVIVCPDCGAETVV